MALLLLCGVVQANVAITLVSDVCSYPEQLIPVCIDLVTSGFQKCSTGEMIRSRGSTICRAGFFCSNSTGTCLSDDIAAHLTRTVDFQIVETVDTKEAQQCNADPLIDAASGNMLCEALHAAAAVQPTFGHSLGNTWVSAPASQAGSIDSCTFTTAEGWRKCIASNVGRQAALLTSRSSHMLISGGLMEYLYRFNLDNPADFEVCCLKDSIGQWGDNNTCVPDVRTNCAQDYYISWGKAYLDNGVRAFFFGQSRLTGGGRQCNPDGTGCSRVSLLGVLGFQQVISTLKAYANVKKYGRVFFGPQAASGFELANGTDIADWCYGAQHLYASGSWLVQPFDVSGAAPSQRPQWYGSSDLHDANRLNNKNELPVLLDFDNFSGDENRPDDIRRLSSWPNTTRQSFVTTLWHILRLYNNRASLSIPITKAAGGNWPAFKQPQGQCWSGDWGKGDGLYFGGYSCNIIGAARALFLGPSYLNVTQLLEAVVPQHFGAALQSAPLTSIWAFRTLLNRDFSNVHEYNDSVVALPNYILGARGARCALAGKIIASEEFKKSTCVGQPRCATARLGEFICLGIPDCLATSDSSSDLNDLDAVRLAMCDAADSIGLFGNPALMDPEWCIGC